VDHPVDTILDAIDVSRVQKQRYVATANDGRLDHAMETLALPGTGFRIERDTNAHASLYKVICHG
jgi:hypothetical protein